MTDYAGRAKVKAVECHGRPVRLAPHKSKSSKRIKSRLSAPRHLHASTSTAHSPLPPSPASVASQTEVAYPASLHRQAESTLAQPSQLSSHVEGLSDDAEDPPTTHRPLLLFHLTNTNEAVHSLPPPTSPHPIVEDALRMLTKNHAMSLTLCPSVTCCTVAIMTTRVAGLKVNWWQ